MTEIKKLIDRINNGLEKLVDSGKYGDIQCNMLVIEHLEISPDELNDCKNFQKLNMFLKFLIKEYEK